MSAGGRSRAAAIALLAGVVAIAGAALVVPAGLYWSKTGNIINDARSKMTRTERRSDARAALTGQLDEWQDFVTTPVSGFVLHATDEAASNAMQERIDNIFKTFGGDLNTVTAEPQTGPRDGVRTIAISVEGRLPRANLAPFLTKLESEPAYIIVTEFDARKMKNETLKLSFKGEAFRLLEPAL